MFYFQISRVSQCVGRVLLYSRCKGVSGSALFHFFNYSPHALTTEAPGFDPDFSYSGQDIKVSPSIIQRKRAVECKTERPFVLS